MTARLRAPGLTRAGLFLVLGTLFCAAIIIAVRELYGYPVFEDGGMVTKAQDGILLLSLATVWSFSVVPDGLTLQHYATVF